VRIFVDVDDIEGAALSLVGRIIAERASGCEVLVNLSGSIRSLGVAAYLAALSSGLRRILVCLIIKAGWCVA